MTDPAKHPHGVDLYHADRVSDFVAVRQGGVVFVIHKASQGQSYIDPGYASRRADATAAGLLWGATHFGTGTATGEDQADHFLDVAQPGADTVLALDFERTPDVRSPDMTVDQARAFIGRVYAVTGRFPLFYGANLVKQALGELVDPMLLRCPLWAPRYSPSWAPEHEPAVQATWTAWTLWQYTDGAKGPEPPHVTPGIGHCDRSIFCGDEAELRRRWARGTLAEFAETT